ncbi:unnamed protein product [Dovyalis caffra]|uniref:Uncharacterized protein n=1 Tax=Dovyalis caffra TaxID=77055 RepID=A0AAV1SUI2_9ROSI|nr:unnamed protein product [Dovyalis caffra]
MATKNLIRAGASLANRLLILKNPIIHQNTNSTHQTVNPHPFPSLSNFRLTSLHLPQTDALSITKVANEGFLHPCGLPSLEFFLPDGDSSSEPMLLFPKRTFQPSTIRHTCCSMYPEAMAKLSLFSLPISDPYLGKVEIFCSAQLASLSPDLMAM